MRTSSPHGFTLVELLIVITIIILLIAILLPTLSAARKQAQVITCASNVRQLVTATLLYADDHQQIFPSARNFSWETDPPYKFLGPNPSYIQDSLGSYITPPASGQVAAVWRCPALAGGAPMSWMDPPDATQYRYNVDFAPGRSILRVLDATIATLHHDQIWSNWTPQDYPHFPGSDAAEINVGYVGGNVGQLNYKALSSTIYPAWLSDYQAPLYSAGWMPEP